MKKLVKILAIDTSCDETAAAVSEGNTLLSNTLSSSMEFQNEWGGVVPIIARKNHINRINMVIKRALKLAEVDKKEINVIAVTYGPGLAIALEVGIKKAKEIAAELKIPLLGINHMAGHIYSNFGKKKSGVTFSGLDEQNIFPLITLLISGGHTELVLMKDHGNFEIIGKTLDDSVGEAFDKIARMLRWGYPGGPIVERFAKDGDENAFKFPIAMAQSGDLNFSFSGLKTAVFREIQSRGEIQQLTNPMNEQQLAKHRAEFANEVYAPSISKKPVYQLSKKDSINIAASFQKAAADQLILKSIAAVNKYKIRNFLLGGGVVNNLYIRRKMRRELKKFGVNLYYPHNKKLLTDNAGMIAIAAYYRTLKGVYPDPSLLDRKPNLELGSEGI
ncbi:tRNA (adenosine(37)-N6)-threonylcarbamoyltransferase complex transferase subunit TsaD [Candidatus Dojkabacteria bacterium]|nr:tRNA (adenosine(37)-N6)-threonylcarbamoyltransferase complex transferase subunit TsaD [Candidatus Dojkabacteria bacterium]